MHRLTGHSGRASVHMSEMSKQSIVPEYLPYVEPFFDLSTLAERLRHEDSVMLEYPVRDGNWHLARFIVQTRGKNGEAEQVLFAMRLYSEEKRREKDLMSAADAARRANEAKSEFLSRMSHDIRTPMNVIMGFTNIALQHADDPGKMKECLEKIRVSGGNLQELIDDVLDISRIESGEFKIVSRPVKLPELFDFYCQAIAGMAEAKNIRFSGKLHDISHNVLLSDQIRLYEPALKRHQVYAGKRRCEVRGLRGKACRERQGPPCPGRERHGHRHDAGVHGADVFGLFPRGRHARQQGARQWPRPCHCEKDRRPDGRCDRG